MSTRALNSEWNRANGLRFEKPLAFGELLAVEKSDNRVDLIVRFTESLIRGFVKLWQHSLRSIRIDPIGNLEGWKKGWRCTVARKKVFMVSFFSIVGLILLLGGYWVFASLFSVDKAIPPNKLSRVEVGSIAKCRGYRKD